MYKMLLCSRYLRTRFIALASIVSVMLGVATMIVVNSVMSGFQEETYKRLHGILSDVVVESHGMEGIEDPVTVMAQIRETLGDDVEAMTTNVQVPAMLSFQFRDSWFTKQVNLIGIDQKTYANVGDFAQYLLHPDNRKQLEFELKFGGYGTEHEELKTAGWGYRRDRVMMDRIFESQKAEAEAARRKMQQAANPDATEQPAEDAGTPTVESLADVSDPFAQLSAVEEDQLFDAAKEQHIGVVLGIALSSERVRGADGKVRDFYLCRPGDDVKLTFPTAGMPPKPESAMFTVVDLYESKMSEYDSTFAFVPIEQLQRMRGMIDVETGIGAVKAIQIRLRPDVDLIAARDKLRERFPANVVPYHVQTWKDMQGPLLAAVQMETTILNILLFLIIGVAGFGILATFYMIVVEKTRDIGILKSLGASSRGVMSIFLGYGMSLGMVGSGVGVIMGLLFVWYINDIAVLIEKITGREVFDPTIYYFQEIPTIINPFTVCWIVAGAMAIAVALVCCRHFEPHDFIPWRRFVMSKTATQKRGSQAMVKSNILSSQPSSPILKIKNLRKSYRKSRVEVPVLRGVDLEVDCGHFTAIIGQSGSGKSTLLHVVGTLDAPDSGEVHYMGERIDNLSCARHDALRNGDFGMIFQFYHLLPELTTLENVLLPSMIDSNIFGYWRQRSQLRKRATDLLGMVGLSHRLKHKPSELSGGEMQRVAIARALIAEPKLLLADEPTGNLDSKTGGEIMEILRSLNETTELSIVMVTHDLSVAAMADRTVRLTEGRIESASVKRESHVA